MLGAATTRRTRGQRGRSRSTLDLIETCIDIIGPCQPITVRGVAYKLFVAGVIDSMANRNTQKVSRILRDAREEGRIPWAWIVDESRQMEAQPAWSDLEAYGRAVEASFRRDFWSDQSIRPIVISEKATVAGVLRPVLEQYGVPFFAAHGFNSATKIHDLATEMKADARLYWFLYVGDHDPSGLYMAEIDFRQPLCRYGAIEMPSVRMHRRVRQEYDRRGYSKAAPAPGHFLFERIAVESEDLTDLPSFPAKKQDPRYQWYRGLYGEDAWELDAMSPDVLRKRIDSHIHALIDPEAWDRHQIVERAQRETTREVVALMAQMDRGRTR